MRALFSLIAILALASLSYSQQVNTPIIAILTIPTDYNEYPNTTWSYIAASYVKFIEAGGAQVVPLRYDLPQENMTYILDRVNGVLFTGGDGNIVNTTFGDTVDFIVNYVIEQNNNGNYYPLWGTCMGFEIIACVLARNYSVLTPNCVGCIDINSNNFFNEDYESRMFAHLPHDLKHKMTYANLSFFDHVSMIAASNYETSAELLATIEPVTYSYDADGNKYLASFESPDMPIYAIQFHAEKATYEWRTEANHSLDAVRIQQHLSNFFVNEARKNPNTFPDQDQYVIDNFNTTKIPESSFDTSYVFPVTSPVQLYTENNGAFPTQAEN